ncbi:MAG: sigma factor-like helix-turn-helix DNA-binding protein [Patescibacteria group bacterium]
MATKTTITFKPKIIVKKLLSILVPRAKDVISSRYGLGDNTQRLTLEAIGKKYTITRERVRQIENYSLDHIRKSKEYKESLPVFEELKGVLDAMGSMVPEEELLISFTKDKSTQNHIHFLLVVGEQFTRFKEDEHFKTRWHIDSELADLVHESLKKAYQNLSNDDLITEPDFIESFIKDLEGVAEKYKSEEIIKRWLSLSKKIGRNPLGEWGKADSSNINARGMRDYAFLVIRKHGSPIHFREVAESITKIFNKKAHVATTHNELIKDPRFVLVGRGLYALAEWGYMSGVVKDVIRKLLDKHGPLTKQEIIDKVLKERYVKENTIVVNLQNPKYFKKDSQGRYSLAN